MATEPSARSAAERAGSSWSAAAFRARSPAVAAYRAARERMEERAQIPPLYRNASFENFNRARPGKPHRPPGAHHRLPGGQEVRAAISRTKRGPACCWSANRARARRTWRWRRCARSSEKGFECLFCNYQNLLNSIRAGYDPSSNSSDREAYRVALDSRRAAAGRPGRAPRHRLGGRHHQLHRHLPLRQPEAAHRHHQPAGPGRGQRGDAESALGKPEYRETLADRIGARARSRLFEMCTVIRMPLVEDYRLRKARTF